MRRYAGGFSHTHTAQDARLDWGTTMTQRWETFETGGAYGVSKVFFSLAHVGSRQLQHEHERMLVEKINQEDYGCSS